VLAEPGRQGDGPYLVATIVAEGITTVHFVPSLLRELVATPGLERCEGTLRRVIASGEALPWDLQESWSSRLRTPLYNLYGPTEAAVEVTWWRCRAGGSRPSVPIGWAVPNTQMYVLDRELEPVPVGVAGELFIGGMQVGRGYHGQPGLTAERFLPDPSGGVAGGRLYRTGDLARRRADGALEFLGRLDGQVKVRGFRIEPGEIESALAATGLVREAVVVAREVVPGERRLIAYVVPAATGEPLHAEDLRETLLARLPEYMVPAVFVELAELPLSPNGKVDRRALPRQEVMPDMVRFEAPRDEVEARLAEIWSELLQVERVGIHDGFFTLGGDSILALQMVRLAHADGLRLTPQQVFQHQTIAGLGTVAIREEGAATAGEAAALLDEPLSADDMAKILVQIGRVRSQ
jgi:acyl-coenzyme A synthetase/AMP-(fatty) acid ligase